MLSTLCLHGQVTFRARIFLPGGYSTSGMLGGPQMIVEGEDTARHMPRPDHIDTTDGTVCFTGIARGARCYLILHDIGLDCYDYPVFTINEDMTIDSLVLRQMNSRPRAYCWNRDKGDSALRAEVDVLSVNPMARDTHWYDEGRSYLIDDEPHALELARLYYADWVFPIPSWRTFPHAADSAYHYAVMAYDSKKTPWLYPAICQLHRHLGLRSEPKVRKPKQPKVMYRPLPYNEASLADTTVDLMTLMERRKWLDDFLNNVYPELGEPSLCCPVATEGTLRYMVWSPWGYVSVLRLEGRRLFVNKAYGRPTNQMKLEASDEFDLNDSELAEVRRLFDIFLAAHLPDEINGIYVIDGADYMLEYILGGEYHTFRASEGGTPKVFDALTEYLWGLYRARH